jgi:hypothetical protein
MNRFKLVCLLIILSLVAVLLGQNRELLSLKLFCPDVTSQSCLYETPALPLAAWIGLFAIAGIISSLLWQFFNQLATPSKTSDRDRVTSRSKPEANYSRPQTAARSSTIPNSDWEESQSEDWEGEIASARSTSDREARRWRDRESAVKQDRFEPDSTVYRVQDKTPNVSSPDSTYSYKFREAKPKKKEEEVSQDTRTDEVYDVNYRTVRPPSTQNPNTIQDDEEWI